LIQNATITAIAPPPAVTSSGGRTEQAPTVLAAGLRCFADEPKRAQMLSLANVVSDASMVVYVPLEAASNIVPQSRITIAIDRLGTQTLQVLHRRDRVKPGMAHAELFLKAVTL
jgi:hypothetical protein